MEAAGDRALRADERAGERPAAPKARAAAHPQERRSRGTECDRRLLSHSIRATSAGHPPGIEARRAETRFERSEKMGSARESPARGTRGRPKSGGKIRAECNLESRRKSTSTIVRSTRWRAENCRCVSVAKGSNVQAKFEWRGDHG